ncbi:MAG: acetate--CoA ligase family protein [Methanothrix sp.]|uniref:acetate--CoA ligase (ADP-forming) n=1 Tax=Methanothrix harundinacea TaxID=301375 RepID=A0A101IHJ2_9EURY|nr:MAG: CoA-binding domain protein [Methanothrix harundinacea]KUK95372.1 MAG: CoA-binding domain protein [Methanothrix harundinacea]MCP1393150.1 acetate--CoA ligase family protein [Methanothrix harundinacea]MDD3710431.1 acetate--CoA ligase family protein [Methanothrix sp.]MDI9397933.1 acetate--CoA ligase family protein [Euryarchaeota archaeon]
MAELFREVVGRAKEENRTYLMEHECKALLESLGISTTGAEVARSEDEAVRLAESIGYPVVLKVVSPEVVHKSDAGGVRLGLMGPDEVRRARLEMVEAFRDKEVVGIAVQEMAPPGTEAIVGVARDPTFGPILMFGLGGIFVEILQDVSLKSIPITETDADEMIAGIKGHALLGGYRGRSADIPALRDLLMKISDLVMKYPEIAEMDLNPVFLYPDGYRVVDARIIIGDAPEVTEGALPKIQDLHDLFYPKSIAVIGASGTKGKLGWNVFCNLINHDFEGDLYPINPKAESILGIKAYPRISAVKKPIDVAVILVQASMTPEVVKECCDCGVKYVIVESAGFAEMGDAGRRIEEEMKAITDSYGVRLLGPNCSGIINTHCSMVQSIGIVDALSRGNIGLISQAGVCAAGMLWGLRHIMDFGIVATIGNKLDINETDMLEAVSQDENVNVICMYLESVKGGRRFIDVAKRITTEKPIIALKSGRTEAGKRAVASHTASIAGNDLVYSAVFQQARVIRARDYEHMFNLARAVSKQPFPKKEGVFIITYAGSLGVISADAVIDEGMKLSDLEPHLKERLLDLLPEYVGGTNPVDYTFSMDAETVKRTIEIGVESEDVGSFIVILQAEILGSYVEPLGKIDYRGKPIMVCVAGKEFAMDDVIKMENVGIPVYQTPEQCADAISVMYKHWKHSGQ